MELGKEVNQLVLVTKQEIHDEIEVVWVVDVFCQHREVLAVKQQLTHYLQRLSLGDILVTVQE